LIDVASCATNEVKIPGQKATHAKIMHMFKDHLMKLKAQLNVCVYMCILSFHDSFLIILQGPTIQGEVSLTCDAWQASNMDGYFVVIAHWIEDLIATKWELKSALIGFMQLNNAHNGEQLGQALFKIVK
jgi:hypothetical protein